MLYSELKWFRRLLIGIVVLTAIPTLSEVALMQETVWLLTTSR